MVGWWWRRCVQRHTVGVTSGRGVGVVSIWSKGDGNWNVRVNLGKDCQL